MTLEAPYLPVILFILIGTAVGVAPQVLGFLVSGRASPTRPRTLRTNADSRPSKTRA